MLLLAALQSVGSHVFVGMPGGPSVGGRSQEAVGDDGVLGAFHFSDGAVPAEAEVTAGGRSFVALGLAGPWPADRPVQLVLEDLHRYVAVTLVPRFRPLLALQCRAGQARSDAGGVEERHAVEPWPRVDLGERRLGESSDDVVRRIVTDGDVEQETLGVRAGGGVRVLREVLPLGELDGRGANDEGPDRPDGASRVLGPAGADGLPPRPCRRSDGLVADRAEARRVLGVPQGGDGQEQRRAPLVGVERAVGARAGARGIGALRWAEAVAVGSSGTRSGRRQRRRGPAVGPGARPAAAAPSRAGRGTRSPGRGAWPGRASRRSRCRP